MSHSLLTSVSPGSSTAFPDEDAICESCGYPLRGVTSDQACPECGQSVSASDPDHRPGLPWQSTFGLLSWFKTVWLTTFVVSRGFRMLRVDRPGEIRNGPDRLFLATLAVLTGLLWAMVWWLAGLGSPFRWGWLVAMVVVIMTYVEIFGVAYFSQKRGWRVSLALAERVGCFCAVGWIPAALLFEAVLLLDQFGVLASYWPPRWGMWDLKIRWLVLPTAWGVSILGFETLVWLGIRQVKYANYTHRV